MFEPIIQICPTCDSKFVRPSPLTLQEEGFTGFMRTLRGRDQEKVIRKKEELWGRPCREGERGTAHFVIALWPLTSPVLQQGPYEHWRGRLDDLNERLFFYSRVITFVKTSTEYLESDRPLNGFLFVCLFSSWISWQAELTQTKHGEFLFFFCFAQALWLHKWKNLHYIPYLCNTTPAQLPWEVGGGVWRQWTRLSVKAAVCHD